MSNIGALVAYKGKPAKIIASTTHKYEISFSDGSSQKVREKDFHLIHPEFSNVTNHFVNPDTSILNDLEVDSLSLKEVTEWLFEDFSCQNAWCVNLMAEDSLYFYWSKDSIMLRTLDQVKVIEKQRNDKAIEKISLEKCIDNLNKNTFTEDDLPWIKEIEQVALNQSKHTKVLSALLIDNNPENAHQLLLKIKYWSELTNPYPERHKIYIDDEMDFKNNEFVREDLTHLISLAIDNSDSSDADDAISIEGDRVWIHIADVANRVDIESELDIFAQKRASNLYLPDKIFHMLPPNLASICSLGHSEISEALSIGFKINNSDITDIKVCLSNIKVTKISYDNADIELNENEVLSKLNEITISHKAFRDSKGAIKLDLPNVDIRLKDGIVSVMPQVRSKSRELVTEMMIIAGRVIAQFSIENDISMPYLSQEVGNFSDEIINNKDNLSAAEAYQASRSFNRSKISTEPSLHAGLGLSSYIRVTSPMRRYLDMVVQQQLSRFINELPTLDDSKIKARIKSVNLAMSKVNKATRQSIEHFKCLYLKQNKDWNGEGIIVEIRGDKALILIPKLAMMTQIKFKSKIELDEEVKIKVSSINLSERLIEFKPL